MSRRLSLQFDGRPTGRPSCFSGGAACPTSERRSALVRSRAGTAAARALPWQPVLMPDHVMNYVETAAPAGLTLVEWRKARIVASRRNRRQRLREAVFGHGRTSAFA